MWEAFKNSTWMLLSQGRVLSQIYQWKNPQQHTEKPFFKEFLFKKPIILSLKAIRVIQTWLVDPFTQVKSAEHMAKIFI